MEIDIELKNEIHRKIGRNVVLFQRIEMILKFLLTIVNHSGYLTELPAILEQRKAAIGKQTLGQLTGQFVESTFGTPKETTINSEELREIYFSFRFNIKRDDAVYEERKRELASIVDERNDLIHHLFSKWNLGSSEGIKELEKHLDQQQEKLLTELENLKSYFDTVSGQLDFLNSDEGKKQMMLRILHQTPLVRYLFRIARKAVSPEGWVLLSHAAQFIRQEIPEEIAALKTRYQHKNLKSLILETELFELGEESTDKGGVHVWYRIRPDLNFAD